MASLRHRFAKSPSAAQNRPRRRTPKGPGNESAGEGEEGRPAVLRSFCSMSKRALIGRRYPPATGSGFGGSGCSFAASAGGALYARRVYASPGRPSFPALSARCVGSEPAGAAAVDTSRAVPGRGVSARSCRRRQNERSAPVNFRCRRRKYTGRRAYPRTIRANYTGRRGAEALRRTDFPIDRRWRSNRAGDGKENPGCTRKNPREAGKEDGRKMSCPGVGLLEARSGRKSAGRTQKRARSLGQRVARPVVPWRAEARG
jgi:hypothetical protein